MDSQVSVPFEGEPRISRYDLFIILSTISVGVLHLFSVRKFLNDCL